MYYCWRFKIITLEDKKIIKEIASIIKDEKNKTFIIGAHMGPDGDNVGSTMALYYLLTALGKEVIPYNPDSIPESFTFIPNTEKYNKTIDKNLTFDVGIVVDNSEIGRIGKDWPIGRMNKIIQIDHHLKANRFGDTIYIDEAASSVGEMLYFLFEEFDGKYLTKDVATALYISIVTDTGSFKYNSTSSKTFYVAQKLLEAGASPYEIHINVYENVPLNKINLLQEVLSTLELNKDGNFAIMYLSKEMLEKYNADKDLAEGFVNYGRIIKGVEISCFLKEIAKDSYKISLRSNYYDVSYIAREYFNGGGHKNASGGRVEGKLKELILELKENFTKWLKV